LLPGWQETQPTLSSQAGNFPPFAFASDAASLHVIAALPDSTGLRYNTWISTEPGSTGRWSPSEVYTPAGRWRNLANAAAAVPLTGNSLAFAWLALPETTSLATPQPSLPGLFLSMRGVPAVQPPEAPVIIPTSIPSPSPTVKPTSIPMPTLQIDLNPAPTRTSIPPLALGGGLAAIIVLAIFIGILLQGRTR
jgi:hypothetical protein